ncbi:ABC transporter substrate-binding protein [Loigolactobacillus zhaoyuanensis]|uniref:ABC transporter substrate-binding protein n=1 Tax=Loigolactobacillus zhaoyuanensis TaxID=2486017 RepID=A0ABW8UDM8_9LACO
MRKRHWWQLLIVMLLAVIMVGCGKNSASQSTKTTTIKIGYMANVNSASLVAVAKEAGYFEKQGLKVKLVTFQDGPSILAAMKSGSIDFGQIGTGAHTALAKGQAKVVLFDSLSTSDKLIANKKSGITSIKDLKGKKVAVVSGTSSQVILDTALESAGLSESDVTIVNMSAAAIATAMTAGKVDAAAAWSPSTDTITSKLGSNAVTLASDNDYLTKMPSVSSWVVTKRFASKNSALIKKFDTAMYQAMDYRVKGGNTAKWTAKLLGVSTSSIKTQLKSVIKLYTAKEVKKMAKNGALLKLYTTQQNNFVKLGLLKQSSSLLTPADYVDTKIMQTGAD